jgi:hypothetical protein
VTGVAGKVREILTKVRARITSAADRLLSKIGKAFKPKKGRGAEEKDKGAAGAAGVVDVGDVLRVEVPGREPHTLSIDARGKDATVMLRSKPQPVKRWLGTLDSKLNSLPDDASRTKAATSLATAKGILGSLDADADAYLRETLDLLSKKKQRRTSGKVADAKIEKKQRQLRDALVVLFKAFGGEGVALTKLFEKNLDAAHQAARPELEKALKDVGQASWSRLSWEEVKKHLEEASPVSSFLKKPLLMEHGGYSAELREKMLAVVKDLAAGRRKKSETAGKVPRDDEIPGFISNRIVRPIHASDSKTELSAVRDAIFENLKHAKTTEKLKAAFNKALDDYAAGDQVTPELKEAVDKHTIKPVLIAMAKNHSIGGLSPDRWETLWALQRNKDFLKSRFRSKAPHKHEWIPVSLIGPVVSRARSMPDRKSAGVGLLWLDLQDAFRAPTKGLVFDPGEMPVREVTSESEGTKGQEVKILQGHPGAVYAPYTNEGFRGAGNPAQQTLGSPGWHKELKANFTDSPNTLDGMKKIIGKAETLFKKTTWKGTDAGLGTPLFEDYYDSEGKGATRIGFEGQKKRWKVPFETAKESFEAARKLLPR